MPNGIKLILSILVVIVALGVHFFQARAGQELNSWLVLGLAAFMVFAMWIFPEAKGYRRKGSDRR